jgi:hypothetical protein
MAMNLADALGPVQEIQSFLEFLVAGAPPSVWFPIISINKAGKSKGEDPKLTWKFFRTYEIQQATDHAMALHSKDLDVYTVPTMYREVPPEGERGGKGYLAGGTVLWADVDNYKDGVGSKEEILRTASREPIQPSWIVDSGNGLHMYWKVDTFLENFEDIEKRNRGLARRFGADACHSAEHLMRVPGLKNLKKPDAPKLVRILKRDGPVHGPGDFDIVESETGAVESGIIEPQEFDREMIGRLNEELRDRIEKGPQGEDRSSNDWFVACALLENGYTPGQVLSIFLCDDFEVGEKAKESITYAYRTIKKAAIEAKRRASLRPRSLLQPVIDKMIFEDQKGVVHLDLPVQGYDICREACVLLEKEGYRFVYDETDGVPYIIGALGDIMFANVHDRIYNGWISHITLFTSESRAFRLFQSGIIAYIQENGKRTTTKPWVTLDLDKGRFYVLTDHTKAARICYVSAGDTWVTHGGNGVDNKILFPSEITQGSDLEVVDDLSTVNLSSVFGELFDLTYEYFAVPKAVKEFLTCYMLAVPLASSFTKHGMLPLLHLTGRAGQGKTEILKILSSFLQGSVNPESGTTVPGARGIAARDVLLPFDDYEELSKQMKEFILTSATGAVRHKANMDKGQSLGLIGQKNHILIALSSIADLSTDTLRRRALRVEVSHERFPTANFNSMYKDKILRSRSMFWSAYMKFVAQRVLGNNRLSVANYYKLVEKVSLEITVPEFKPMSEFLALCWYIAQQLATIDARFVTYTDDIACIRPWLGYFELLNGEVLESYNELLGMLEHLFESLLREIQMQEIKNTVVIGARSPTGSLICSTPLWMTGLSVELPKGLPQDLKFNQNHTLTVSGKMQSWVSVLSKTGDKAYFSSMSNPVRQMYTAIRNLVGIAGKLYELPTYTIGPYQYTGVYPLGGSESKLFVQFVFTSSKQNPVIRLFYSLTEEQYTIPSDPTIHLPRSQGPSLARLIIEAKAKLEQGKLTEDEARDLLQILVQHQENNKA